MWGMRPDGSNPRLHIKKYPEEKRGRYLSQEELSSLGTVLAEAEEIGVEDIYAITAIRLLVFTGCRLNEIITLKWSEVDFENGCLRLSDSKTGARIVHLGPPALDLFSNFKRQPNNPWVICDKIPGTYRKEIQKFWQRIRKRVGIEDVRIHDLRHSFASNAVAQGMSLPMIGKFLGHMQVQTTARYAHLAADPVKAAANRVSSSIAVALTGTNGSSKPVPT